MKLFDRTIRRPDLIELPLIPLKDQVAFPGMVVPFFAGKKHLIEAVEEAMAANRKIFMVCQKNDTSEPREEDIHTSGCVCYLLQVMKLPDGSVRVLAEGQERASILTYTRRGPLFRVEVKIINEKYESSTAVASLMRTVQDYFKAYSTFNKKIPAEVLAAVEKADRPDKLCDIVCAHVTFKTSKKVELLGITSPEVRLKEIALALQSENEILELQQKINSRVKKRIERNQKEYYLQEQMKEINRELGKEPDDPSGVKEIEAKIGSKQLPEEVQAKAIKELRRLERLQPISPEAGILRTYLEWITDLPWNEKSDDSRDLARAEAVLEQDHYDMKKPKERILDFIAVRQLKDKLKGPILCFVGPPGTGKTSLGRSVARCLGRQFVRISLGGVRDEAEIRGHRKTYVGALPGKILQSMRKAGTRNPVFLLDEIDKMSSDFRGDPASALLEVLDPEQNYAFVDHYLEVPYDLSDVLFITTANTLHTIPYPLRDRMEVIEIPGYTEFEKLMIAEGFIIPKQIEENGLGGGNLRFRREAIRDVIQNYTMESGVRSLEREIAQIIRKIARKAVERGYTAEPEAEQEPPGTGRTTAAGEDRDEHESSEAAPSAGDPKPAPKRGIRNFSITVTTKNVRTFLGKPRHKKDIMFKDTRVGLAYGLAWTELGGTVLPVEAVVFDGKGELLLTGSLGEVMKESALTAYSFLKSYAQRFHLDGDFYRGKDVHIHVPEGAIPKDGPSAGITLAAALLSALSGLSLNKGICMTGEITLTGKVLPIGGVKEKVLAAHRTKFSRVLLPEENRIDIDELPREVVSSMEFVFTDTLLDSFGILFPEELFQQRSR